MGNTISFDVVRPHIGDRDYARGDTRTGTIEELGHLVPRVLVPREGKADAPLADKAEGRAPENKANSGRKADKGRKAETAVPAAAVPQVDPAATEAGPGGQTAQPDPAVTQADAAEKGEEE